MAAKNGCHLIDKIKWRSAYGKNGEKHYYYKIKYYITCFSYHNASPHFLAILLTVTINTIAITDLKRPTAVDRLKFKS